jgi:hypothetical protein
VEDFRGELRQVSRFRKFEEGGSSMEDQDRETGIDEDVEAHSNIGQNLGKDEGDDVEGHAHKQGTNLGSHKLANDEGDDVEGHVHKAAPNLGSHKA